MVSATTRQEIEASLGRVPGWMEHLADPAADHSWGIFRDLNFGETELTPREKALIGVGVAAGINCPYCTYFHKEEARLADVTDDELVEAVNLASSTQYFSTVLHGNEEDLDTFIAETSEIMAYIREQQASASAAD